VSAAPDDGGETLDLMLSRREGFGVAFEVASVVAIRGAPDAGSPVFDLALLDGQQERFERRRYAEFKTPAGHGQLAVGDSLFAAAVPRRAILPLPAFLEGMRARAFTSGAFLHAGLLYATLDLEQLLRLGPDVLSPHRSTG
jgi:hypothetical protein